MIYILIIPDVVRREDFRRAYGKRNLICRLFNLRYRTNESATTPIASVPDVTYASATYNINIYENKNTGPKNLIPHIHMHIDIPISRDESRLVRNKLVVKEMLHFVTSWASKGTSEDENFCILL